MAFRADLLLFCLSIVCYSSLIVESRMREVFGARCQAGCLAKTFRHEQQACTGPCNTACLKPCIDLENFHKVKSCKEHCKEIQVTNDNWQCRSSCKYLLKLYNTEEKSGTCPSHNGSLSCSHATCIIDKECPDLDRCCHQSANCGKTCQRPSFNISGYPSKPQAVNSTFIKNHRSVVIQWSYTPPVTGSLPEENAVVFIVEARHISIGPQQGVVPREWNYLNTTKQQRLAVYPKGNVWSEYRILAVNEKGTSDYSLPSPAIYIPPENPTPPRNFRVKTMAAVKNKVQLELVWSKPQKSDIPVHRYRVFWSRRLDSHTKELMSLRVHHRKIRPDQHSFVINGLRFNTTYVFEIQAICRHDGQRLRSKRVYLTARTMEQEVPDNKDTAHSKKKEKVLRNSYKKPSFKKKPKLKQPGQTVSPTVPLSDTRRPENVTDTRAIARGISGSATICACLSALIWLLFSHTLVYW